MRWAAFDFETATGSRDSACAVGVVVVDNGVVSARQAWLIRPPGNQYYSRNTGIHGIDPGMTEDAPAFNAVWAEVEYMVGDRPLLAHNAAFDVGVLEASAHTTGAVVRPRAVWCSMVLSRRVWPDLGRWNLPTVAEHVGARLNHHDALSDAAACSEVIVGCLRDTGCTGLQALGDCVNVQPRHSGSPIVAVD